MDERHKLPYAPAENRQAKPSPVSSIARFGATTKGIASQHRVPAPGTGHGDASPPPATHKLTARIRSPSAEQIKRKETFMAQVLVQDSMGSTKTPTAAFERASHGGSTQHQVAETMQHTRQGPAPQPPPAWVGGMPAATNALRHEQSVDTVAGAGDQDQTARSRSQEAASLEQPSPLEADGTR